MPPPTCLLVALGSSGFSSMKARANIGRIGWKVRLAKSKERGPHSLWAETY